MIHTSGLTFDIEETPQQTVVRCAGNIVLEEREFFQNTIRKLMSDGKCTVVDLADVTYIDSSGLGALVSLWSSAQKQSVKIEIVWGEPHPNRCGTNDKRPRPKFGIGKLLHLTGLDRVFASAPR